ncbi:ExeM/NucH family extracellular endonuclease [Nakamurella multipartita]|uniref:ExeM/NucH family extracellular endonuclease n=1 Tax=Nakamurella multipartita TaxID=53461 RepID=UPI00019EA1C6|nr:ExeM/NucH family extracellular endonuclease [Nakamurella multipartita]
MTRSVRRFLSLSLALAVLASAVLPGTAGAAAADPPAVWVNEIHYDNAGTDVDEAIEVAGPAGTDLTGWSLVLYNGDTATAAIRYRTLALSGSLPDQSGGYGTAFVAAPGLQNGDRDGFALVDAAGTVVQLLSYEGVFTAADGPAAGRSSTDIGIAQSGAPVGSSLQLTGTGRGPADFTWASGTAGFGQVNAGQQFADPNPPADECGAPATPIGTVQGSSATTALAGQRVSVQAVVTAVEPGLGGFYLQDPAGDGDPATADGLFVYGGSPTPAVGDAVRVTGTAGEYVTSSGASSQTQLSGSPTVGVCQSGQALPEPVAVQFPLPAADALEPLEGMRVSLPQTLVISEYFNYDRFGEVVLGLPLAGQSRPFTPTAVVDPGPPAVELAARNALSRITLDDGSTTQNPAVLRHPGNGQPFGSTNSFRGGDTVTGVTGVLDQTFGAYRVQPTGPADYAAVNPRPDSPPAVGGSTRVASQNVLNYFLTVDDGTTAGRICGPARNQECRGADNADELARQRTKILAALGGLDADVVGLLELENTPGVDPAADLVAGLNARPGAQPYASVDTGVIGGDAIRVGLLYRPSAVQPVGGFQILDSTKDQAFIDTANRPVLVQTFQTAAGGRFTVAVAHLKSKGSACAGDPDAGDGQGNCNQTRTAAAAALARYLDTDPTGSGDPDRLIVGDLNSYDHEDPIRTLREAGYTDQIAATGGEFAYGYVFDGQAGYLDHALASASLTGQVTAAGEWHINADEPDVLDYDTTFKSPEQDALFEANQFRASDHDPVLVGIDATRATAAACYGAAQQVSAYQPGTAGTGRPVDRRDPAVALGPAGSDSGGRDAVSLGRGGQLTLAFTRPLQNLPGPDLTVVPGWPRILTDLTDRARVSVSADGVSWVDLGTVRGYAAGTFDLGGVSTARFLRITDTSGALPWPLSLLQDGYDLDGVDVRAGCA